MSPKITMQNTEYNQVVKCTSYVATLEKSLYGTGQNGAMGWTAYEKPREIHGIGFALYNEYGANTNQGGEDERRKKNNHRSY